MSTQAVVREAIYTFVKATGHYPKRVLWSNDVKNRCMAEERERIRRRQPAIPLRQLREEASRPGMVFVSSRRFPPGMLVCDDGESASG